MIPAGASVDAPAGHIDIDDNIDVDPEWKFSIGFVILNVCEGSYNSALSC